MKKHDKKCWPCADYRFWLHDPEGEGLMFYKHESERDEAAKEAIEEYLDDYWAEEVTQVCAGTLTHMATQTNKRMRPAPDELDEYGNDPNGEHWMPEWDYKCQYEMLPLPPNA